MVVRKVRVKRPYARGVFGGVSVRRRDPSFPRRYGTEEMVITTPPRTRRVSERDIPEFLKRMGVKERIRPTVYKMESGNTIVLSPDPLEVGGEGFIASGAGEGFEVPTSERGDPTSRRKGRVPEDTTAIEAAEMVAAINEGAATCKGSKVFGTACNTCVRCRLSV